MEGYDLQVNEGLFGSEPDISGLAQEPADSFSSYPLPPDPGPVPYMSLYRNSLPLPMPVVPEQCPNNTNTLIGPYGELLSGVPNFNPEKIRALWRVVRAARRPGSHTIDPDVLLERFLSSLGSSAPKQAALAPNVSTVSPKYVCNVAHPTQRQPRDRLPPAGAKISHARDKNSHNRIGDYKWYDKAPVRETWSAQNGCGELEIKYSTAGELNYSIQFDRASLNTYIRGCALQGINLRLWVQNSATMHTDRYPTRASPFCRATNCPVKNKTISRGMYQVCFDEHPEETSNGCYDPFYVAGFMHLFCLEEMIPMAELMSFADVRPDTRDFPLEQRNPMSLDRDGIGRTLLGAYQDWKKIHYDRFVDNNRPLPSAPRKSGDCLYKHLTVKKMEFQPTTRQKMRDQRNGFDISKHYGNLRKLMSHKADKRRRRKSKAPNEDNSEDVESDNEVAAAICAPPRKRQRSELPPVPATPLRRSYRLLNAAAALGDEAPTSQIPTFPDHVAAPVAAPLSVTVDNTYDAYGFPNYAFATIPDVAPMTHAHTAPRNLNVVTAQAGTMARHNVLGSLDLANVSLDMAPEAFRNFYEQIQLQSYATEPQTGLSPLPVYGASPQSPYPLRDTQARRESAVRLLSARTSLLNTGTFAIDPQLLQGPYNGGPAEPASPYNHVSNTEDGLKTPTRRVTRSMSRTVAAPFEVAAEASRSTILESTMGVPAEPTPGEITRLLDLDGSGDLFNEPSNDDGASFDIDLYLENYASANLHSPTPLEDSQVTTHEDNEG